MATEDQPKLSRYTALSREFTPNAPINRLTLFRGRLPQIFQISSAISQPGQHVALYGDRGVGKTSLANLLTALIETGGGDQPRSTVKVNCTTQDGFRTIWTKVFREMGVEAPKEWDERAPDPDDIRWTLQRLPKPRILVLDEFDRVDDDETLSMTADVIKSLSDHQVTTKVVIVGVADSIDQLIGEHESIQRCLEEVNMPRMTSDEIHEIIDGGLSAVKMKASPGARVRLTKLSAGLPHYAHLLTLHAGQRVVMDDRSTVETRDVEVAMNMAAEKHSLVREYQTAIQSARKDTLYSRVLAACALAETNRLGYFTPGAVRKPMSRIMGKPYDIPAFAPHLDAFTSVDRGSPLQKEGPERRYTYRFRNPLLQQFAIITAMANGEIPEDYQAELFSA